MSRKIRILIADDSNVTRRILTEALSRETGFELAGAATNGAEAVAAATSANPDVILMDVDMPVMNGIEAVRTLRSAGMGVPVVMFSTPTFQGCDAALDAMAAGANDSVSKPAGAGHIERVVDYVRQEVLQKLRVWGLKYQTQGNESAGDAGGDRAAAIPAGVASAFPRNAGERMAVTAPGVSPAGTRPGSVSGSPAKRSVAPGILAIGSSTGGPQALMEVIGRLPPDLDIPVVVVQHMPPRFSRLLAERLDRGSPFNVREGQDGAMLNAGDVWIAPGDQHMTVVREGKIHLIRLNRNPPENSCRPAVDVLFRSVSQVFGAHCIAVVLTGMGRDGTAGCQLLQAAGATVFVQDEATSVVWGMPRSVCEAGCADAVLPLPEISMAIMSRLRNTVASTRLAHV